MKEQNYLMRTDAKDKTQLSALAIPASIEHECDDAQPVLDPDYIKRFCQVWGEVGRAILNRRDKGDNAQGKTRFDYPGGCVHQSI